MELSEGSQPAIREPEVLGDLMPADRPGGTPASVSLPGADRVAASEVFTPSSMK